MAVKSGRLSITVCLLSALMANQGIYLGIVKMGLRQCFESAGCKGYLWPDLIIIIMTCFSIKVSGQSTSFNPCEKGYAIIEHLVTK